MVKCEMRGGCSGVFRLVVTVADAARRKCRPLLLCCSVCNHILFVDKSSSVANDRRVSCCCCCCCCCFNNITKREGAKRNDRI